MPNGNWTDPRQIVAIGLSCGCIVWTEAENPASTWIAAVARGKLDMSQCLRCGLLNVSAQWIEKRMGWYWADAGS